MAGAAARRYEAAAIKAEAAKQKYETHRDKFVTLTQRQQWLRSQTQTTSTDSRVGMSGSVATKGSSSLSSPTTAGGSESSTDSPREVAQGFVSFADQVGLTHLERVRMLDYCREHGAKRVEDIAAAGLVDDFVDALSLRAVLKRKVYTFFRALQKSDGEAAAPVTPTPPPDTSDRKPPRTPIHGMVGHYTTPEFDALMLNWKRWKE